MRSSSTLNVDDLSFSYRDREGTAIRGITFELEAGQLMLVAGASGCGKTTLIRSINGLVPRSYKGNLEGQILIKGETIEGKSLAEISQHVGTVLQDPERQILGTKVLNEVAFGLENLSLPRPEILARVDRALERLGIQHLRERETHYLSGGEKQKVALAGVLAMEPSLLLLDEPLASLDPASAQEALRTVRGLVDEGISVLIVEHRVEDVLGIEPETVMYMEEGSVEYLGPPSGLQGHIDYNEVKLPAGMVLEQAAQGPAPEPLKPTVETHANGDGPLVQFHDVSFAYEGGPQVLHGVDLEIGAGEIIAVLGPNGAGKTTLVKHAIGLLKPTDGQVLVDGEDTQELSIAEVANTLGYVFQSPSHMLFASNVHDELAFGPKNLGHDQERIEEEVEYAIDVMNLSGMGQDPPLALSFGQQKRVSIAAILAMRSRILVMDEPTAGQDYKNYTQFMDSILTTPGFEAVLFITHDVDLALVYANRVLLISDGRLAADGPPEEVLRDFDRLRQCRLVPTSLLQENLARLDRSHGFMRAEALAHVAGSG